MSIRAYLWALRSQGGEFGKSRQIWKFGSKLLNWKIVLQRLLGALRNHCSNPPSHQCTTTRGGACRCRWSIILIFRILHHLRRHFKFLPTCLCILVTRKIVKCDPQQIVSWSFWKRAESFVKTVWDSDWCQPYDFNDTVVRRWWWFMTANEKERRKKWNVLVQIFELTNDKKTNLEATVEVRDRQVWQEALRYNQS